MDDQKNTQDVHALVSFIDILGNTYYEEYLFSEEECQYVGIAMNVFAGKTPFDMLSEPAKDLTARILGFASGTIAKACIKDFDRATQLLVAVRKQNVNQEINEIISIAIRDIAELKQLAPPFAISSDKACESIASAFQHMPPIRGLHIGTYNQLKWDYLNKRRSADYGE